jgi:transposase-like protein
MDIKQEIIRRYFKENDSERKIARDLQLNRKTVKRYLVQFLEAKKDSKEKKEPEIIQDFSGSPPVFNSDQREKRKLSPEIAGIIQEQLRDNERKKKEGLRKQIKLKVDIHELLLSMGHQIGYTTVCNYIRKDNAIKREAYIKQVYLPGEECEFDWGEVKLYIQGTLKRLYMAVFTAAYGNYRYSKLYSRQDTLAFMESHNDFFAHVDGVYHEMVYDNMRVAVSEFVGKHEKNPTKALLNLSGWFQFRWRFCNVRRGNEKGHVERSVEYIRRKAFCHIDHFDTLEEAQTHLDQACQKINMLPCTTTFKSPCVSLVEEKKNLWEYPGLISCFETEALKVDKYSTISHLTNRYSVPDDLVGRMVDVKVYANKLKVYHDKELMCQVERSYGNGVWQIKLEHYLNTLSIKPGALHGSMALEQASEQLKNLYQAYFVNQPRSFVELLLYCKAKEVHQQKLVSTITNLESICPRDVSSEKVMALLGNQEYVTPLIGQMVKGEIELLAEAQLKEIAIMANHTN